MLTFRNFCTKGSFFKISQELVYYQCSKIPSYLLCCGPFFLKKKSWLLKVAYFCMPELTREDMDMNSYLRDFLYLSFSRFSCSPHFFRMFQIPRAHCFSSDNFFKSLLFPLSIILQSFSIGPWISIFGEPLLLYFSLILSPQIILFLAISLLFLSLALSFLSLFLTISHILSFYSSLILKLLIFTISLFFFPNPLSSTFLPNHFPLSLNTCFFPSQLRQREYLRVRVQDFVLSSLHFCNVIGQPISIVNSYLCEH